jgi:hypothetical protein
MDFSSSTVFSRAFSGVADGIYDVVVIATVVVVTPVRGTALSVMTSIGVACSFSFTNLSSSSSISLNCAFCSMINLSISSFSDSVSAISFACASSVGGSFSCFLRDAMSNYFS